MEKKEGLLLEDFILEKDMEQNGMVHEATVLFFTAGAGNISLWEKQGINRNRSVYQPVRRGDMLSLPSRSRFFVKAGEEGLRGIQMHLLSGLEIPWKFFEIKEEELGYEASLSILSMDDRLLSLADTLGLFSGQGIQSHQYTAIKLFELCQAMQYGYKREEAVAFFRPLLLSAHSFSDFVMRNYQKVKSVEELVSLSPYSLSVFKRRFREVFGEAPYRWMKAQKATRVLHLIRYTTKSFSQISFESGFSSQSQFNAFCKACFGMTPSGIRKRRGK